MTPASYGAQMLGLLTQQFQGKPRIAAFLNGIGASFDALEREGQRVLYLRTLDFAEGAQLDLLGDLLGEARADRSDIDYRRELRFVVMQNVADGTPDGFIRLVQALANTSDVTLTEDFPAGFTIEHTGEDVVDLADRIRPLIPVGVGPVTLIQPGGTVVL